MNDLIVFMLKSRFAIVEAQIATLKNYAGGAEVELSKLQIESIELQRQLSWLSMKRDPFVNK